MPGDRGFYQFEQSLVQQGINYVALSIGGRVKENFCAEVIVTAATCSRFALRYDYRGVIPASGEIASGEKVEFQLYPFLVALGNFPGTVRDDSVVVETAVCDQGCPYGLGSRFGQFLQRLRVDLFSGY